MFGLLSLLYQSPIDFAIYAIGLVIAITIHEFSHAFVADKLGDPTPRIHDRVNLNPLSHLDPIGTLAILIAGFGWGKPVVIDPYNLENPKRDSLIISLAGPASNLILAIILAILLKFLPLFAFLIIPIITLNIALGIFNLVPIPPLDGSKIIEGLLPRLQAYEWEQFANRYGFLLLLLLVMPLGNGSIISLVISPIISFVINILI